MRRWKVLQDLLADKNPKVGAEIGVQTGRMTYRVLQLLPSIETYYAIDPWLEYEGYIETINEGRPNALKKATQQSMNRHYKIFRKDTKKYEDKIVVLKMFSSKAASYIPDELHPEHTPVKYVRLNFHVMRAADGSQNFSEEQAEPFLKNVIRKNLKKWWNLFFEHQTPDSFEKKERLF